MDLIYPQSGLSIPGHGGRNEVLCPVPGKKVINIVGFFFGQEFIASNPSFIVCPDEGENNAYLIDIHISQSNANSIGYPILYDFSLNPIFTYPNRNGSSGTVVRPAVDLQKMLCRQLDVTITSVSGGAITVHVQGYQLQLQDL